MAWRTLKTLFKTTTLAALHHHTSYGTFLERVVVLFVELVFIRWKCI
jgi:hypothetical protein